MLHQDVKKRSSCIEQVLNHAWFPKQILVPISNGSEDIETTTIIDVLRRAPNMNVCHSYCHRFSFCLL